jgi:phosphoribosylformimino-5-aminoimidazole carboxamide ribotide isomerase
MRVIGVVDLLAGCAVHARAGRRGSYGPVRTVAGSIVEAGDALALAGAYLGRLGLAELYAADLDAIMARAPQDTIVKSLAQLGAPLWLDAGVSSADRARHALGLGASVVVIGLETLSSYEALAEICAALGGERVAFSLDLRDGEPIVGSRAGNGRGMGGTTLGEPAHAIAAHAAAAGVGALIVIDLARVGTGAGLDLPMVARVRDAAPGLTLLAGGGVRGLEDLAGLADAGCDGALVATALQDGRLSASDVAAAARYQRSATR